MSPPSHIVPHLVSVAVGVLAAVHAASIRRLLPALYGSFQSFVLHHLVPPLVFTLLAVTRPRLPLRLVSLPLLFLLPAVHAAKFPLSDLILLALLVAVVATHNLASLALFLTARTLTPLLLPHLPSSATTTATPTATALTQFRASPAPHLLVALLALYLVHQSRQDPGRVVVGSPTPRVSKRHARRGMRDRRNRRDKREHRPRRAQGSASVGFIVALVLVVPVSLLFTTAVSPGVEAALRALHPRPMPSSYRVLAQTRGATGLISVVEKVGSHRMLTADLSVLGGYHRRQGYAPDSIFSQFHVHEAVRLTRRGEVGEKGEKEKGKEKTTVKDQDDATTRGGRNGRTLCIGVGVGVVTRALRHHGCDVDAVELDDAVAAFARHWFSLPGPVTVADARNVLQERAAEAQLYDYVVHDAFTGGGVSTALVSESELRRLRDALREDGVLVMNVVAYGRRRVVAAVVYDRLARVFGHVRMFSEIGGGGVDGADADEDDGQAVEKEKEKEKEKDGLDNVVLFASRGTGGVRFRPAGQADFIDSQMREDRLRSFERGEIGREGLGAAFGGPWAEEVALRRAMWEVGWQHARLMKKVHPAGLWPALVAGGG